MATNHPHCANCDEPLHGAYCSACGQRDADLSRSLWVLVGESISEAFELDGRLAHTIGPFFLRPGELTQRYLTGRRASQVPPIRLFVSSLAVAFLAFWFVSGTVVASMPEAVGDRPVTYTDGTLQLDLTLQEGNRGITIDADRDDPVFGPAVDELEGRPVSWALGKLLDATFDAAPPVIALLIPIMAILLELILWRRAAVHHVVLSVHFHSLVLWVTAAAALTFTWWAWPFAFAFLAWHGLVGLRRVYGLSWRGAIWRFAILAVAETVLLAFAFLGAALIALRSFS